MADLDTTVAAYFANNRPMPPVAEALVQLILSPLDIQLDSMERELAAYRARIAEVTEARHA